MCKTNILFIKKSKIEGKGLFCKNDLMKNDCIGLLAKVYGDDNFDDEPYGRYINHSYKNNIDLKLIKDKEKRVIYVLGIANKYIPKNEELLANYNHNNAPKPNFITERSFNFENKLNNF